MTSLNVIDKARAWIAQDPDPDTRAELEGLIAQDDREALEARFDGALEFGTAGLRGLLGAGPTRMNRVSIARATFGLCAWLHQEVPDIASKGICIAHDARHKSDVFANDATEIVLGAGIPVYRYSTMVATPLLAFAVRDRGAGAGIMITASHNPPDYNGYKVFWENGAQIIPPHDTGISNAISNAPPLPQIPRLSVNEGRERELLRVMDRSAFKYVHEVAAAVRRTEERRTLHIAYTALHGVSERLVRAVFSRTGFCKISSVAEQARPNPDFPTVRFPNPEEPGAMDLVLALGREVEADLAIANDPDGDRVAVSVRHQGEFRSLTGNDVGLLLADDLLTKHAALERPLVLNTVVSSPALGQIAQHHAAHWEQTLTGHKWIQNRALALEAQGYSYVFGYEEALGYAPIPAIRDKDGVSSALLVADLASRLKARGETLIDARAALWQRHGVFADTQISVRFSGSDSAERMVATMRELREAPPTIIGGKQVTKVTDLSKDAESRSGGDAASSALPSSDLLIFALEGENFVMVRPSGTEPKIKYYLYARAEPHPSLGAAEAEANALLRAMKDDLSPHPSEC